MSKGERFVKSNQKRKPFIVVNRKSNIIMDKFHIIGCGTMEILQKNVIQDFYVPISFSFDYIKQAEQFFKSIQGDQYDESKIKVMMPSKKEAPVVFIYEDDLVFCIAPRYEGESELFKSKK